MFAIEKILGEISLTFISIILKITKSLTRYNWLKTNLKPLLKGY